MARAKSRRVTADDEVEERDSSPANECTNMDHIYPGPTGPGVRCFCGKREFRPFIQADEALKVGQLIRTYLGGPVYEVEMVNTSRARCRIITAQQILNRREEDRSDKPVFLPIPGSQAAVQAVTPSTDDEDEEKRGRVINISPRSAVVRVSAAEFQEETLNRSSEMAKGNIANIPVAGKAGKIGAKPPTGAARPLSGAAAKAKAGAAARPKVQKTVRKCGCGCGGETMAHFVPGHDARYKGWMKKLATGELTQPELKKFMGKQFDRYTFKKSGAGFVPKETYQEAAG